MPKRPRACSHLLPHHRGEDWHWRHEQRGLECLRDPVRWYLGWYCHAGRDVGTRGGGCRCHHGSLMEQKHGGGVEQHDRRGGVFVARCGRSDARSDLTNLDPMISVLCRKAKRHRHVGEHIYRESLVIRRLGRRH